MAALLALLSSVMWGVSDFLGGVASRRLDPLRVTVLSTPIGVLPLVVVALITPGTMSSGVVWVALGAGVAGMGGILLLYVALSAGPMGVMSPLTAVVSAIVPVSVGLARGERPGGLAYVGMALAVAAIVLVSVEPTRDDDATHQRIRPQILAVAVLSGVLIGLYLTFIGIAPADSGVLPVLGSRLVSAVLIGAYVLLRFRGATFQAVVFWPALVVGLLDASANALYRFAVQAGMLAVVAVLAALYPAATVLLARFYLHERLRLAQQLGMVAALAAAALLALS